MPQEWQPTALPSTKPRGKPALANDAAPNLALPWVVRLRYGMAFGGAAVLLAAAYVFRPNHLLPWTLIPLALVLASNTLLDRAPRISTGSLQSVLGVVFVFDTLCLTAVLGLTGGPMNPFSLLYLVQITLSVVVLKKAWTWILGTLSSICFGWLFFFHLPFAPFDIFHTERGFAPHLIGMWVAFVVAATLISFFTSKVSDALRLREQEVLTLQQHVAKQERLASLVTLAAGAAHELGTPLGTIAVVSRELERYASALANSDELREDARLIRSEVERCRLILQRMSANGAEPMGESPQSVQVNKLLEETFRQLPEARQPWVSLELTGASETAVLPVRATIQSLVALVQNAIEASVEPKHVILKAQRADHELIFSIRDHGRGMTETTLRRIAEPFFTTKPPDKGMGLGTFLVRTFAERLGGHLLYESVPGHGTTATLTLPIQLQMRGGSVHVEL